MPDLISRIIQLLIGAVLHPADPLFQQVLLNLRPIHTQKRPDIISIDWAHTAQSPKPCTTHKPEQHSLCLIPLMMRQRDHRCLAFLSEMLKHPPSCISPGFLKT